MYFMYCAHFQNRLCRLGNVFNGSIGNDPLLVFGNKLDVSDVNDNKSETSAVSITKCMYVYHTININKNSIFNYLT